MQDFTIIELSSFMVAVLSGIAMLCGVIQKSKCKQIKIGCGCIQCTRDAKAIELDLDKQAMRPHATIPVNM